MKKETLLDNCIKTDLKIIESDLQILLLIWTALFALGLSWGLLVLAVPAIIAVFACLFSLYKKLCGTSLYGGDASLFRTLPIPVHTLVLSKIFTGGLVFAAMGVIYYICLVFRAVIYNGDPQHVISLFEQWIYGFVNLRIDPALVPLAAVLDFLNMAVRCFTLSAMILLGMTAYFYLPKAGRGWIVQNSMLYVGMTAVVACFMAAETPALMQWLQPPILQPVFHLTLSLVLLAISYKVCVILIEKKDGGV